MMINKVFICIFLLPLILLGCKHEWQDPNTSLPARKVAIDVILTNSIIYDSAGVIVEGKVWDLEFDTMEEAGREIAFTEFKLADQDGNYIKVFAPGYMPVVEGDIVEVTGIFRRDLGKQKHYFTNEIEAIRVERDKQVLKAND